LGVVQKYPIYILEGLFKNPSKVQPKRVHADTHGQSTAVFGLAYLLGIELMPRIENWRSLKLYRADTKVSLSTRSLYSGTIDWALIEAHWEDCLQVVLAIQSGCVSPSWVLARLNSHSRRNRLYLTFQELGRVVRTVNLLNWIADDALRSGVTDGANKVESFHEFADFLHFGSRGLAWNTQPRRAQNQRPQRAREIRGLQSADCQCGDVAKRRRSNTCAS
jgi:TnpA family transposase